MGRFPTSSQQTQFHQFPLVPVVPGTGSRPPMGPLGPRDGGIPGTTGNREPVESGLVIRVAIRTHNELNARRQHWRAKHDQRAAVKEAITYALLGVDWRGMGKPSALEPWTVRLVRLGPREMDDDGVVSALKSVRDAFAAFVNVNDKHRHIVRYSYDQERAKEFGVRIEVRGFAI
jgi:hypothetical protein